MGASGYMDPNEWLEQSLATDGPNNAAGFSNPELDALIAEGLREQDREARAEIYQQAQQIVIDEAPWISLYTSDTYEGLQPRVQGFDIPQRQHAVGGTVWLDEGRRRSYPVGIRAGPTWSRPLQTPGSGQLVITPRRRFQRSVSGNGRAC